MARYFPEYSEAVRKVFADELVCDLSIAGLRVTDDEPRWDGVMTDEQIAELVERLERLIDEKEEEGDRLGISNIRQANFTTGQAEGVRLAISYLREYI